MREEWGFVGVLVLLALFIALIWVSLEIAARAKGHARGVTRGRYRRHVVFLRGGQYRNDRRDVSHRRDSAASGELRGSATIMTMASLGLLLNVKRRRLTLFY